MRAFMCIHHVAIMDEKGIDGMEQSVVQPVGCTFPMLIVNHYHGCIISPIGFLYLKIDNYPAFFVRKAHFKTILSCSTFL